MLYCLSLDTSSLERGVLQVWWEALFPEVWLLCGGISQERDRPACHIAGSLFPAGLHPNRVCSTVYSLVAQLCGALIASAWSRDTVKLLWVESSIDKELPARRYRCAELLRRLPPLPRCPAHSSCQRYWGIHARGRGKKKKKTFYNCLEERGCELGGIPVQSCPEARVGTLAVWTHTSPGSTAAPGAPVAQMRGGARPHWSEMLPAHVAGRGVLRGSGTPPRLCPPRELGARLPAGPSWSPCGTVCGKAPARRAPRAEGLAGSAVRARTAGSAPHRWAFPRDFALTVGREKLRASWGWWAWFGNLAESSLLTWGYDGVVNGRPRNPVVFRGVCGLTPLGSLGKARDAPFSFFKWLLPSSTSLVLRWFYYSGHSLLATLSLLITVNFFYSV